MTSKKEVVRLSDIIIPKYQPLVNSTWMHNIITSGRAGTKSSFISIFTDFMLVADPGTAIIVMRKHHNKLAKTVYKESLRALSRLKLNKKLFKITKSPMQITYLKNGNTIYFTGSDSVDDTKGIIDELHPIKYVVLDELTEFFDKGDGEDEINNIIATFVRGNDETFRAFYLFNPPKNPKHPCNVWVQNMLQRKDTMHIHSTYKDVPVKWLGQKLIDEAEAMKIADEKMYRWVWLGEAVGLDELIYYMFTQDHVVEQEKDVLKHLNILGIGIDYGQMNATTFQCFGIDFVNKKLCGIGEYYHSGRESGHQKSPSVYASDFKVFVKSMEEKTGKKVTFAVIDPSAKGLQEEIKRVCPQIKFISADNTVIKGINRVQKLLSFFVMTLDPSQVHAIEEFQLYEWNMDLVEKGKEEPVKDNDHCMDAIRYLVMYVWKYMRSMLPVLKEEGDS